MKEVAHEAKRTWSGVFVAREGMQIDLAGAASSGTSKRPK